MTYSRLLVQFLFVPIVLLGLLVLQDRRQKVALPPALHGWSPYGVLAVLIIIAVTYTLPWDNHLVATRVWWYDPGLVSGRTLGWIPLEEIVFFGLQPLLIGLWLLWLAHRLPAGSFVASYPLRWISASAAGGLWLVGCAFLILGWRPATYLGWELVWVLPPIILQLGLGADILWRHRQLLCFAIIPVVLYLSAVDAFAIHDGIWTINQRQSLDVLLLGQLPLEECVFFLVTTVLVTFGLVLGLSSESRGRLRSYYWVLRYRKRSGLY